MFNIIKTITAFILGLVALLLFYYFVSIPILPCITVYITSLAFAENKPSKLRTLSISIFGLLAISLYGINTLGMIKYYPEYGNAFSILFSSLTIFAFIGATIANLIIRNNLQKK